MHVYPMLVAVVCTHSLFIHHNRTGNYCFEDVALAVGKRVYQIKFPDSFDVRYVTLTDGSILVSQYLCLCISGI